MKVLIIGGGMGGLTLAHFFEAAEQIDYTLVERTADGNPLRQGLIVGIWNAGRDVLKKIGLSDAYDAKASPAHYARFVTGKGALIKTLPFRSLEEGAGAGLAAIKRSELRDILLTRLDRSKIRFNTEVKAITQKGDVVTVTFHDNSTDTYDLVVGADGVNSFTRKTCFPDAQVTYANWRVWCSWIPMRFGSGNLMAAYLEPNELAVTVHTHDAAMVWLVTPTEHTLWDTEEGRVGRLKTYFKDISSLMPDALNEAKDNAIPVSDMLEVHCKSFVSGRVALIGDAAHCLGPYTGFSGSMAMEDAEVLAEELIRALGSSQRDVLGALKRYDERRKPRVETLRAVNAGVRYMMLSRSSFKRSFMNLCLRLIPAQVFVRILGWVALRRP